MRISDEIIEKIKEENDIVEIVSESVRLKRTGRNYIGLCPFHNDKSPSFSVSQDKHINVSLVVKQEMLLLLL